MISLIICPRCGRIHPVTRRKKRFCSSCETVKMEPIKLTFEEYIHMTEKEREDYILGWMYIRNKGTLPDSFLETTKEPLKKNDLEKAVHFIF